MKKLGCILLLSLFFHTLSFAGETFLVFGGKTGWIGQMVVNYLEEQGYEVYPAESRLERRGDVEAEIARVQPDYIINCAGLTGRPNVDWCEDHKVETLRTNVIGTLNLIDVAYQYGIHVTNFNTGCIYEYDEEHPMGSGIGFSEEDEPNFDGSFYSKSKGILEKLIPYYPNLLNLRVRMPISSNWHWKNFVVKISKYAKVINIPNSMTILDDLLPVACDMTLRGLKGNYNFVNPGTLSHNEILDLYQVYVDPTFTYENFTVEQQDQILKARRSNNELDASKLLQEYPDIPDAKTSIHRVLQKMYERRKCS
ncbi:NAD-dependent epimerase/dehydratase family protein [Simkania sp.]|uniref:NAD-dependent epimerase/dehydratase family protein n=1 Tax=Simkania sp. TaxID=34094 RepID=UPI003B525A37